MAALNWPGLLAWSTKYHDGTHPSQFKQMSAEDRAFLEKAFEEAFGKVEDPNKVMLEAIAQIRSQERTDESIATALEVIDRLCDDPDVARNAEKLDGVQTLLDLAVSKGESIRCRTLEILALIFSNNPNIQQAGFKRGGLEIFLKMVKDAPKGSEERSKAFRALVALVRQLPAFEATLLRQHDGVALLVELLSLQEEARTREKAASFARSMAGNQGLRPEEVGALAAALVPLLAGLAGQGSQYREILSGCALELARASPTRCPQALREAAQARLAEIQAAGEPAGDEDRVDGGERASLEECVSILENPEASEAAFAAAAAAAAAAAPTPGAAQPETEAAAFGQAVPASAVAATPTAPAAPAHLPALGQ